MCSCAHVLPFPSLLLVSSCRPFFAKPSTCAHSTPPTRRSHVYVAPSQDDDPDDMSMAQYLQFVKDARIKADHWLPSDDDMIFILANREPCAPPPRTIG